MSCGALASPSHPPSPTVQRSSVGSTHSVGSNGSLYRSIDTYIAANVAQWEAMEAAGRAFVVPRGRCSRQRLILSPLSCDIDGLPRCAFNVPAGPFGHIPMPSRSGSAPYLDSRTPSTGNVGSTSSPFFSDSASPATPATATSEAGPAPSHPPLQSQQSQQSQQAQQLSAPIAPAPRFASPSTVLPPLGDHPPGQVSKSTQCH